MPRVAEITVPASQTATILQHVQDFPAVISVRLEKGSSIQPPGDVITVAVTDRSLPQLLQLLDRLGVTRMPGMSLVTSRPTCMINVASAEAIRHDASHFVWEEMDQELNKESSMTISSIIGMLIAGVVAVIGIETNALHLVIGAMVIAPGFEPISRIVLGLVSRSSAWKRGAADFLKGYVALIFGAVLATLVLQQWGYWPQDTQESYLAQGALIRYWTSVNATSLLVSAVAAIAGALLIIGQRSVLTAGVMIALALIPAATITGMGIATLDITLVATGLFRFVVEVSLVALMSGLVFLCNFLWIDRRRSAS